LPNPATGRTDLEVVYSGTSTYSFSISCQGGYVNACPCYDYVFESEISVDVPDNPCCVTITVHQSGWSKSFYPFSIECCCDCDPFEVDNYYDVSYCCPSQNCPQEYVNTYRYCCCCNGTVYSPVQSGLYVTQYIDTKTCTEHNQETHEVYTFTQNYCSTCSGGYEYDDVRTVSYIYTIYDPDNCCRFCIPPLERYDDDEPFGLVSRDYWGPTNVAMVCGTWPCIDDDNGIPCTPNFENVVDCDTSCAGVDCVGSGV